MNRDQKRFWSILFVIVFAGALLRVAATLTGLSFGTDDEATFGLMAQHIRAGTDFPVMGWGAHYGGALQSYIAAFFFGLFGSGFVVLKLSVLPFSLGLLVVTALYGRRIADEAAGLSAAWLAAVPAPYLLAYAVNGFGIYAQIPFFTILLLILTDELSFGDSSTRRKNLLALLWGLTAGIAVWILPLFVVVILAGALQFLFWARPRFSWSALGLGLVGGGIGLAPFIAYNLVVAPCGSFLRLGARAVGTNRAAVQAGGANAVLEAVKIRAEGLGDLFLLQFKNLGILFGLERLSVLLAVLVVGALAILAGAGLRRIIKEKTTRRFTALFLLIPITLLFSLFANLDRPRTLITLYLAVVLLAGAGFSALWRANRRGLGLGLLLFLTGINLFLTRPYLKPVEAVESENAVVAFLRAEGIHHLYSELQFAVPLMFITNEEILVSTELARTPIKRHPTADQIVAESNRTAVLLHESDPVWNESFESRLSDAGIQYRKKAFPPFVLLYDFDPPLKPELLPADEEDEGAD